MAETTALARKFKVEVNTGTTLSPTWSPLLGITEFAPVVEPVLQDSSDYDTGGWTTNEKTMQSWKAEITFMRKQDAAGDYPLAQEKLREAEDKFSEEARVEVRWYDRNGGPEAKKGTALVAWERANSGVPDLDAAKVTLTGDGELEVITNPVTP